jgi:MFS superfamily sulfate permease-like transporter
VGEIPAGLPPFGLPGVGLDQLWALLPGALSIAIVGFAESVGAAKNYALKHKYEIDPDQEFIALGVANVGAGFSQGFVVDGSLSKSAAADASGQRTQMSSIINAGLVLITILILTPLFYYLPEATLGAVVIHAVWNLMDVRRLRRYWELHPIDFWTALVALIGVLALGILEGLVIAILLALIAVLRRASAPRSAQLGSTQGVHGEEVFVDIAEHPEATTPSHVVIYRFEYEIFFANASKFQADVRTLTSESDADVRFVVVDAESITDVDVTGMDMLAQVASELRAEGIEMVFARARVPVHESLEKSGLVATLGEDHFFSSVRAAVAACTSGEVSGPEGQGD